VAPLSKRQGDRIRAPQPKRSRDEQVRLAVEALQVVVSGRLHLRDAQGEMLSFHGSPFKTERGRVLQRWRESSYPFSDNQTGQRLLSQDTNRMY
jgi:hypothetical protein